MSSSFFFSGGSTTLPAPASTTPSLESDKENIASEESQVQVHSSEDIYRSTCLQIGQAKIIELGETIRASLAQMQSKFQEVKSCLEETAPTLSDSRLTTFYENLFGPEALQSLQQSAITMKATATPSKRLLQGAQPANRFSSLQKPGSVQFKPLLAKKPGSVQYKPLIANNKLPINSSKITQKSFSVAKITLKKQTPIKLVTTPTIVPPLLAKKIQKPQSVRRLPVTKPLQPLQAQSLNTKNVVAPNPQQSAAQIVPNFFKQ